MFTGLVEGVGELVGLTPMAGGLRLAVKTSFPATELTLGESVAVAGACLTVVALAPPAASFEVSPETLACTTFSLKKVGDRVNLERAVRLGDRLGGHLVTGHVDGIGVVRDIRPGPAHTRMTFELPGALSRFVIEKGSIAVNGVSLTVNLCQGHTFTVNVIPFTGQETTLAALRVGIRSTWRRTLSASTWPGSWARTAPGAEALPRNYWRSTDSYEVLVFGF